MKNIFRLFVLFFCYSINAQTVNTGELIITPGTIMSTVETLDNRPTGDLINDGDLYVYSHYNNDGLVTFTAGSNTGITRMRGLAGFQNISGSIPMEWNNGEFNNTNVQPAFHQSNIISIAGQLDFYQGIVDNDNFGGLLVFEDNAYHANVDDASHVDGYVQKNGDDAFQFPIGDSEQFRYASISAPDEATDAFTGKYFWEDSNPLYPHTNRAGVITLIDNAEYWTIDRTTGNSDIFLTLTWDEDTTPSSIYAAPYEEIHIVRWDATQNLWIDEGGVADPATKEVTTVVNPVLGFGVFTLARVKVDNILPCGGRGLVIYNAVSPNGDGVNDYFFLDGIDSCPNNKVEIYNRWGVKVYETSSYDSNGNVFRGYSEGRVTVGQNEKLPSGTYFYILNFLDETGGSKTKKSGYLYLNDN
ncbi:gliding motility-associated C-terminal domain-containing protein [Flavobacterium azooxidireducens]|uniref:Gliding motility-associated C-terminal domain-containing protein n=1 Tax=Flavobacterium azooxidireducens TaxID=1871076 RepID=A0ABY4KBM4_9FLAO|nr:gliding motility-associated C-terminal domain-containing protein [Flavobacterium azooxidireducens]UPQ78198.1 gliding motility-associated C-terminal domain-containing protein [Flavobacterium azooxidireducens]